MSKSITTTPSGTPAKSSYVAPKLTTYGSVRELTGGASMDGDADMSGMSTVPGFTGMAMM